MKEDILDLIIVETNEEHSKIWEDYFSKKFKIKIFNSLNNCLKYKSFFNNESIFIIQTNSKKSNLNKILENKVIYLIDHNVSATNIKSDENIFVKKPVSLRKIEKIIYKLKKYKPDFDEETLRIKQYILMPFEKKLYSNDKRKFVKLTEKEVQILIALENSKTKSSKKDLLRKVWKYNTNIKTSTVETHIHRLRKKLQIFSRKKLNIKYGILGYYII